MGRNNGWGIPIANPAREKESWDHALLVLDTEMPGMMKVSTSIEIAASPAKVWQTLTDFAAYSAWHPFVRITGENAAGAELRYTLRKHERSRGWTVDAVLLRSVPCSEFVVTFGMKPFLVLEEFYLITAFKEGSTVEHGFRYSGLIFRVPGLGALEKRFMPLLSIPLKRLQLHVAQSKALPTKPRPAIARRKGFRQAPRRRLR